MDLASARVAQPAAFEFTAQGTRRGAVARERCDALISGLEASVQRFVGGERGEARHKSVVLSRRSVGYGRKCRDGVFGSGSQFGERANINCTRARGGERIIEQRQCAQGAVRKSQ